MFSVFVIHRLFIDAYLLYLGFLLRPRRRHHRRRRRRRRRRHRRDRHHRRWCFSCDRLNLLLSSRLLPHPHHRPLPRYFLGTHPIS